MERYDTLAGGIKTKVIVDEKQILSVILSKTNLKGVTTNGPPKGNKTIFHGYNYLVTINKGELVKGDIDEKTIDSEMEGRRNKGYTKRRFILH